MSYCNLGINDDEYIPPNCTTLKLTDVSKLEFLCNFLQSNTTIKTIDLQRKIIGLKEAKEIAKALRVNRTVTKVNLTDCSIGDEAVKVIAKALKVNCSVTMFHLLRTQIGAEGAKAIAEALKVNKTIVILYLGSNLLGDEGAKAIAEALKVNHTIMELELSRCCVGVEGLQAIAEALKVNCIITRINLWDFFLVREIQDELKINQSIGDELQQMYIESYIDLKFKIMALGLLQKVPIYLLLDIHELVVILYLEHKTNFHKFYNNNFFSKLLESKAPKKCLLGMMDKINRKLI